MPTTTTTSEVVHVSLAGSKQSALVDRSDYDNLTAIFPGATWVSLIDEQFGPKVYLRYHGHVFPASRLIAKPDLTQRVRCANGDRLDLRRSNLFLAPTTRARTANASARRYR